jgi:hypothetical protein
MKYGELTPMLEKIVADYKAFSPGWETDKIRKQMVEEFIAGLTVEVGSKYIKIITGSSVHSFIVRNDNGKFKAGDILKAASWRAPAKNFARGNIFDGTLDRVRWTGAL